MYNRCILIGRITATPELKQTQSGVSVTSFTLAVDRRYSGGGEKKADFLNVTAWRQQAEFVCKYFQKGDPVGVEGSIQTRSYEDKQGQKRTAVEIQADGVFFVGSRGQGGGGEAAKRTSLAALQDDFKEVETDQDLPF